MGGWVIGVDLGGTKVEVGLVNPRNEIVGRRRMPTRAAEGPRLLVERITQAVHDLAALLPPGERYEALGICSPGPVDHLTGTLIDPPNLSGLHNAPLRQMLSEALGVPVRLEHDAKATALGEFYYGAGQGENHLVYVIVGTGVGAAIISDGQLLRGKDNSAGEIGHVTLDRHGERCACGSIGCVETFLSGPWLALRYSKAQAVQIAQAAQVEGSGPVPNEAMTAERVAALAAQGDPIAVRVFEDAGEALGVAVSTLAMVLNVDLFVVGGSVAKAGDLLLEPARRTIPQHSYRSVGCGIRLVATALGDDGPILGCSWLARQAAQEAGELQASGGSSVGSGMGSRPVAQVNPNTNGKGLHSQLPVEGQAQPVQSVVRQAAELELAQLEQVTGTVLDIQRFSVHDGPGIRTNVFLKGCPLRCGWCANPESQRPHAELALTAQRCMRCGQFVDACVDSWTNAETQSAREKYAERAEACPTCAMHWLGQRRTAGEVMTEVLKDAAFYQQSGGVTLTGGEPTFQPRLAEALLRLAKANHLDTAMETSGHTRWSVLERLLPYLDHILYDIKHMDVDIHRQYVGVDNTLILANLRKLAGQGAPVEVRVPLIPGFNADEASLRAIADFVCTEEGLEKQVRLLPYHTLGVSKYRALGRDYPWAEHERLSDADVARLAEDMRSRGVRVIVGG